MMKLPGWTARGPAIAVLGSVLALAAGCQNPADVETTQQGYRGTGMVAVSNAKAVAALDAANVAPAPQPPVPPGGPLAKDIYQNVQVLTDLDIGQFTRLMAAMTAWVSPQQGCGYCHADDGNNASDDKYQKVVARRMLQMTRHINGDWQTHVGATGVTCYTCHRGNNVPADVWFAPPNPNTRNAAGNRAGQNAPGSLVRLTALPGDPLTPYLLGENAIPVVAKTALMPAGHPSANIGASLQDTERTYGFMVYITQSLGVNCTGCHNTRSFFAWDQGRPQRVTAWHGIRMARDLNHTYLLPLAGTLPAGRMGPTGDVPKIGCATCHQGEAKPLNGAGMLADYPALLPPKPEAVAPAEPVATPPAETTAQAPAKALAGA